jgi:CheY-like chemotaxis protein
MTVCRLVPYREATLRRKWRSATSDQAPHQECQWETASGGMRYQAMSPAIAAPETGSSEESIQTILIVEDEVLIRLPLAEYLRDCGYRVFEASNVAEAKAVLDADTPVDLVFSDVNMPGNETGFALASWIRQRHPDTKVLLTSGIANATRKAEDLCEDGPLLAKPYSHALVLQRIQSLLRNAKRRQSNR